MPRQMWVLQMRAGDFHVWQVERNRFFITKGHDGEVLAVRITPGAAFCHAIELKEKGAK